ERLQVLREHLVVLEVRLVAADVPVLEAELPVALGELGLERLLLGGVRALLDLDRDPDQALLDRAGLLADALDLALVGDDLLADRPVEALELPLQLLEVRREDVLVPE